MPPSTTLLETNRPALAESRLLDIAPIFNLIQAGSLDGNFSNLYAGSEGLLVRVDRAFLLGGGYEWIEAKPYAMN